MVAIARHGKTDKPVWNSWRRMHERCYSPSHKSYPRYGGRGIKVCKRWHTFENFYDDMGERPKGKSLDRIDNDKNYTPKNCRWVDQKTQTRNRSTSRRITHKGKTMCISEWAEYLCISPITIRTRLHAGWSEHDALTRPVAHKTKYRQLSEVGDG